MSGVMTFGEDFLPAAVRTECERIIPDVDGIKPTDAADTLLFLKAHYNQEHSTQQQDFFSKYLKLLLFKDFFISIPLKRWNIDRNKYNVFNSYTVCGTLTI